MSVTTRLVRPDDAPALTDLVRANREFLAPWEPLRDDEYFTIERQAALIDDSLQRHRNGTNLPQVIVDGGRVIGRITLNGIVYGPFQSCSMGYWVGAADNGRGVATVAVRTVVQLAYDELGLHRIQAETLPDNLGSQRVLLRNGFVRYGYAPEYLHIAGRWQDHIMYQLILPSTPVDPALA